MNYNNNDLIKLWANDRKRREFPLNYKAWGVYAETKELNLKFYKCELPDNSKIIVMEHMRENYHPAENEPKWRISTRMYLQKKEYFVPDSVSENELSRYLMELKADLMKNKG